MALAKDDLRFRYRCQHVTGKKKCLKHVADNTAYWCKDHPEKTGGQVLCFEHQKEYFEKIMRTWDGRG